MWFRWIGKDILDQWRQKVYYGYMLWRNTKTNRHKLSRAVLHDFPNSSVAHFKMLLWLTGWEPLNYIEHKCVGISFIIIIKLTSFTYVHAGVAIPKSRLQTRAAIGKKNAEIGTGGKSLTSQAEQSKTYFHYINKDVCGLVILAKFDGSIWPDIQVIRSSPAHLVHFSWPTFR